MKTKWSPFGLQFCVAVDIVSLLRKVKKGKEECRAAEVVETGYEFGLSENNILERLQKKLGIKAFRTSISWARIFPTGFEERPNEEGLQFYDRLFDTLLENGIEPVVTMLHSDVTPKLAQKLGGWKNKEMVKYFARYVEVIVSRYKGRVKKWITINEINAVNYVLWFSCAMLDDDEKSKALAASHLLLASATAVKIGHGIDPDALIGGMVTDCYSYPYTCNPDDVLQSVDDVRFNIYFADVMCRGYYPSYQKAKLERAGITLDLTDEDEKVLREGTIDFLSFSYYSSHVSSVVNDELIEGNLLQNIVGKIWNKGSEDDGAF